MAKIIETTGKTVEEAIRKGIEELKVSRDEVKIDVIDEPEKGMFGILSSKPAKVRVTLVKMVDDKVINETEENAVGIIKTIFEKVGINVEPLSKFEENNIIVEINDQEAGNVMIGHKGETLEALQLIVNNMIINKAEDNVPKTVIDICGYREKRKKSLVDLANKMAGNVKRFKKPIYLEPMSAYDRKVIHTTLQGHPYVTTESRGEEPRRRVVISLK